MASRFPILGRLAIGVPAQVTVDPVLIPRTGLQLPRQLSFDKWLGIGQQLSTLRSSSAWCLGDWLTYGETAYNGRYREAIEQTSLNYQTLRNYAWIAKRFSFERRHEALSFGHHAEVASLSEPEQDFWLRKAEQQNWARNRLRQEVRASLKERSESTAEQAPEVVESERAEPGATSDQATVPADTSSCSQHSLEIHLTDAVLSSCQIAARRLGLSLEEWAARVIGMAVHSTGSWRLLDAS